MLVLEMRYALTGKNFWTMGHQMNTLQIPGLDLPQSILKHMSLLVDEICSQAKAPPI